MPLIQSRRRFLTNAAAFTGAAGLAGVGAVGLGGRGKSFAAEPRPEITTIRLGKTPITCIAPQYVAQDLLHAEGFTDVRYHPSDMAATQVARSELDWDLDFAPAAIAELDAGAAVTMVAGVHVGCFELFAHEHIRSISDLKGGSVGVPAGYATPRHLVSIMASYVGIDPEKDIHWVSDPSMKPMDLFIARKIDAFLVSPPWSQELRGRNIGHSIVNSSTDRPWSQYFCCMLSGRTEFIRRYPAATKRVVRAILKATDLCAVQPEQVAQLMVNRGFTPRYDYALAALKELPYGVWRDYDPEDTIRFYALRLHEAGIIKSSPQKLIAEHTDWRFLNELKRELKT